MGRLKEPKRIIGRDDFGGDVLYYGGPLHHVHALRALHARGRAGRAARVVQRGHRA
jgi:hypothetical protein